MHTPGPWHVCHQAKCPCKQVWAEDHPIAEITAGKWGDDYPALRLNTDKGMYGMHAEAYMEQITYGEVHEEIARGNALLIAQAPNLYADLDLALDWLLDGRIRAETLGLRHRILNTFAKIKGEVNEP